MASCEEVIGEALDIIAYWCGNESIQPTLADLPSQIYAICFHTRLESAVLVLKYSEDEHGNERVWKELEQRDENEDNWTFDEEQGLIGQLGRWNPSESCNLLAGVMTDLLNQLKQQPNETLLNVLEEKLYWLLVFIDHFVADYDSTEIPLQFEAIQTTPDYPLLAFLDHCVLSLFLSLSHLQNASILALLSLSSLSLSSLVLQSILSYLSHFIRLYLPFRPHLSPDIYTIIAITLSADSQSPATFAEAVKTAQLLLEMNLDSHVGAVNPAVWQELVASLMDFARECKVRGKLQGLNDMPASQWGPIATTLLTNMQKMVNSDDFWHSRAIPICP